MRRSIGTLLGLCALILLAATALAQSGKPSDTFTFLQFGGIYQTAEGSADTLRRFAEMAARMSPPPAFVVCTGNLTESGQPEEFARVQEALSPLHAANIKFYALPGNHDTRWNPEGRQGFAKMFGGPFQSFDYGRAHFVLLDSTVPTHSWGHLDLAQLNWLTRDLKKVKKENPIFLFLHHEIQGDIPARRPIDNEFELRAILSGFVGQEGPPQPFNIAAIFNGPGRDDVAWKTNGIPTFQARALKPGPGSCHRVTVSPLMVTIERLSLETSEAAPLLLDRIAVKRPPPSVLTAGFFDPNVPYLARRWPAARLRPRAVTDNPDMERAEYRLNDGPWLSMTKDSRDLWRDPILTKDLAIGWHSVSIRLTTSKNEIHLAEIPFEVERDEREPTRRWAVSLEGPILSSPTRLGALLYVGSMDGRCYALDIQNGKRRWAFGTKGPIVATPALANGMLYIGSTDQFLYALDAASGKQKWRFDTGSPVFARAAITQGIVCLGGNGKIFGVEAATGKPVWTYAVDGFFQSAVTADEDTFYLMLGNDTALALEARTGALRWQRTLAGRPAPGTVDPESVETNPDDLRWRCSPPAAGPAVYSGRLFVVTRDGALNALETQTGKVIWEKRAPEEGDPFGGSAPTAQGVNVYVAGRGPQGDVYSLDAATGRLLWRSSTGQRIIASSPRLGSDGASLAIMGFRGRVSVLDNVTGRRLWGYELGYGNIFSTPEYQDGIVYGVTMANDVQALAGPQKPE